MECPERGDLVTMDFDNALGHEQAEYRCALVLSPGSYNKRVGLAIVCAITNQQKGYAFEVPIPAGLKVTGVILSDQVRTVDWFERGVKIVDHASPKTVNLVQEKLSKLIF
jgi:mRNA interferase MazF